MAQNPPRTKQEALAEILRLAQEHGIGPADISRGLESDATSPLQRFSKLFGTFGGVFLLAGIATFIAAYWEMLPSPLRVLTTLGSGLTLFGLGILCLHRPAYSKFTTPLLLIAALLQFFGWLVVLKEWGGIHAPQIGSLTLLCFILALQHGLVFLANRHRDLAGLTLLFSLGTLVGICELLDIPQEWQSLTIGTTLLALSYAAQKTSSPYLQRGWDVLGSALLQFGYFDLVSHSFFEFSYILVAGGIIVMGLYTHSRTLLLTGACGVFGYLSHLTYEYFSDSLGWPIMLIIMGLAFFGIGTLAIRLSKKLKSPVSPS